MIGWTFCSGIGAPEMAGPWVDWRLASEIEKFPCAVLKARFGYKSPRDHNQGDPLLWGDMTEVNAELARARGIPLPEIIVAGTPCQAFSVAGLRKGTEDPRGNLTLAFVEIVHDLVAARHDGKLAVLWENVPGVLSDRGNAFGAFLGGLVGAMDALPQPAGGSWPGEGMVAGPRARAAWAVLDAQWFGVAQRRRRVFVVVDFGNCVDPAAVLLEPDRLRGNSPPRREARQVSASDFGDGFKGSHWDGSGVHPSLNQSHNTGGIGASNQEIFSQRGAGLVPHVAHSLRAEGFDASEDGTGRGTPLVPVALRGHSDYGDGLPCLRAKGGDCSGGNEAVVLVAIQERAVSENPKAGPSGAGFRQDGAAYTLEARTTTQEIAYGLSTSVTPKYGVNVQPTLTVPSTSGGGQPPAVCFSSKDYVADAEVDLSPTLRAGGHAESHANAGVPPAVAFAQNQRGELRTSDIAPQLTTGGGKLGEGYPAVAFDMRGREGGSTPEGPHDTANLRAASGGSSRSYVAQPWAVRRLTPTECARLQGFPDDHTRIEWRGKPVDQCPDGPQYKAYGNSMAVPVVRYILDRMRHSMEGAS